MDIRDLQQCHCPALKFQPLHLLPLSGRRVFFISSVKSQTRYYCCPEREILRRNWSFNLIRKMKEQMDDKFIASPLMKSYETTPERASSVSEPVSFNQTPSSSSEDDNDDYGSPSSASNSEDKGDSKTGTEQAKKMGRKSSSFVYRIRDHVKMGSKLSETVKGKLRLGAKIIQEGGRENIFKQVFGMKEGEKLLKASQCYLSTTTGPIAGLLFISTEKVTFCSERSIAVPSSSGQLVKAPYKVLIPTKKIKTANESENVNKPEQKYIEIVTEDGFDFWFMGFLRYEKAMQNLEKAISMAKESLNETNSKKNGLIGS